MINEETAVRIMIYEIRDKHQDIVKFVVTDGDVKRILLYLKTRKYDTLMYLYGHRFLLAIMEMFESAENYEECHEIIQRIIQHNKILNDNIPTRL